MTDPLDDQDQAAYCHGWQDGRTTRRAVQRAERYATWTLAYVYGFSHATSRRVDVVLGACLAGWLIGRAW